MKTISISNEKEKLVTKITLGALYMGDQIQPNPQNPTAKGDIPVYDHESILRIDNCPEDKPEAQITWIEVPNMWEYSRSGKLLIADRVLLRDMDEQDITRAFFPQSVRLQGKRYRVHLLPSGGPSRFRYCLHKNAWDAAIDEIGASDAIWHWSGVNFWGLRRESGFICRGGQHPRDWRTGLAKATCGFRPALEPLDVSLKSLPNFGQTLCKDLGVKPGEAFYYSKWKYSVRGDGFLYRFAKGTWYKVVSVSTLYRILQSRKTNADHTN